MSGRMPNSITVVNENPSDVTSPALTPCCPAVCGLQVLWFPPVPSVLYEAVYPMYGTFLFMIADG